MKKIITVIALLISSLVPTYAHAATPKTMVIIDTGVDITHPAIKNNIIYEVCVAGYNSCPNKQSFMEGPGAATITADMAKNIAWQHGTKVASAATQTDSNVRIIELRCASLLGTTFINCNSNMLTTALNWVITNKDKFNIGAVVSPLGSYTGNCDLTAPYVNSINSLNKIGVATIFPTGNDFKYTAIDNPACVTGVLAISAIDDKNRLALYANYSSRVDFAALGNLTVAVPGNQYVSDYGTSLAVAVFGAGWLKIQNVKNLSFADEYSLIKKTADPYTNIMVKQNVLDINIAKALQ